MNENERDRVVFYSKHDISREQFLSKAEAILMRDINEFPNGINDVLELYNIKLYIDNEVYLNSWSQSDIEYFKKKVKEYGKLIGKFMSKINDSNVLIYHEKLVFGYESSFWLLIDNYHVFKNISAFMIEEILTKNPHEIRTMLRHKGLVTKYSDVLRIFLLFYQRSAEILLSMYSVEKDFGYVELYFPKSLTGEDKRNIISEYIDLEDCNTDYLIIIQHSKKIEELYVSDKIRLKAKRKNQELMDNFFNENSGNSYMKYGVSIDYQENYSEIKTNKLEGSVVRFTYNLDFIKQDTRPYSLYLNFKILFEYIDSQNRINIISKPNQVGIIEKTMGMRSKNEYFCGISFKLSQMASQAQIHTYSVILSRLENSLENILQVVYTSSFTKIYGFASNAILTVPTASASALEKVRMIAPELESVLKQYKLFVEDKQIDFELLQMSSSPRAMKDIPSLNDNKYIYLKSSNQEVLVCSNLLFSDQTLLAHVEPFKEKSYKTFFQLLWSERDIYFSNYEGYQLSNLNYLIDKGYIFVDSDLIKITNKNRVLILKDLEENEVASFYHYSAELQSEVMSMFKENIIYFDSSLLSKPEQDYFNFHLNKSEFINGLDLRNSYLHGTQANPSEVSHHEHSYLIYLKLLTLILFKIEDDLLINKNFKIK
jgi:hypothetical protein